MRLYNRLLKAVGWYEPSMDDLISVVGLTRFDEGVLCFLGVVIVVFAVYILHQLETKQRLLDDLVVTFVHLSLVCIPFIVCKKPAENFFTPENYMGKLLYYGVGIGTFLYNMKRLCKKQKNALQTFKKFQILFPTEKGDLTLGDRLKELMPLIVFEFIAVALYVFFFSFFSPFLTFSVGISIFICIFVVAYDLHKQSKKAEKTE